MQVGATVTWGSQAAGSTTVKTGTVVAVVPAQVIPWSAGFLQRHDLQYFPRRFDGYARNHESYLVLVKAGKTVKAKPLLYWPRVSALTRTGG